ncbi:MAG TPA: urate hydroxylase PuuD, partial [Alphaproteobacteria bacterium]|nr:urate hydroxylase PuuD [Alphaproteobacteria bacterium]
MDSLLQEWLDLVVRWIHVVTAIAWIGSSFFFMWLDSHLEKPAAPRRGIE